jgi:hypothetical protein
MTRRARIVWVVVLCAGAALPGAPGLRPLGSLVVQQAQAATATTNRPGAMTAPDPTTTLAYHLATNAVGRTAGITKPLAAMEYLVSGPPHTWQPFYQFSTSYRPVWASKCWLRGARGLSATCLGYVCTNDVGYEYMITMVSPRHYLAASHVSSAPFFGGKDSVLFADTNNTVYYRKSLQETNLGNDISVGVLDSDLPDSVGYLPLLPGNYTNWLSTAPAFVQGIGVNHDYLVFGEAIQLTGTGAVLYYGAPAVPFGLGTNWTSCADPQANCSLRQGDSSDPARLLIGNQLVLLCSAHGAFEGPDYALSAAAINAAMHYLSTHNGLRTDYQLSIMALTNWPKLTP